MTESTNRYLEAARRIPAGETRTFLELAAMAGRPGAARAAGRALAACPARSAVPWHRVVPAGGAPREGSARAVLQLRRLRREGARPRVQESVGTWARRVGARLVGHLPSRTARAPRDPAIGKWSSLQVEKLPSRAAALSRGFAFPEAPGHPPDVQSSAGPASAGRTAASRDPPPPAPERPAEPMERRLGRIDWRDAGRRLGEEGLLHLPGLLVPSECARLRSRWDRADGFERRIVMGPRGYGIGEYRYFAEPIPAPLGTLRRRLYRGLRGAAAADRARPRGAAPYPPDLDAFWKQCRSAGQRRASSILLRYGTGGINHPHRDIYGKVWFPFQALLLLSRRGRDFRGGEFVLVEERPGGEERWIEVAVSEGDLVLFASQHRWERTGGRWRKIPLRHAMKTVTRGERFGVGLVFHLAE